MKEKSFMVVIPEVQDDILPEKINKRLNSSAAIRFSGVLNSGGNEDEPPVFKIGVDSREYEVTVSTVPVEIPQFFRTEHFFSDLDYQKIDKIKIGLSVEIEYKDSFLTSYHDQLKIINALVPNKLAVMDIPSEKFISGKWVKLAAESEVPPSPKYLFTVQGISGEGDEVWLHTHGLKRCGLSDLEILASTKDMCSSHYQVLETIAVRMIENEEGLAPFEPMFLAWLTEEIAMVATVISWQDALGYYPEAQLGRAEDRDDYHSEDTSVLMLYLSPDDVDNRNVAKVQELDEYLGVNTLLMISTEETNRMRKLAQERIFYVKSAAELPDVHIMLKIGLHVDKQYLDPERDPKEQREHIWFELKEVKKALFGNKDYFRAVLTQEPYYVSYMKAGDTAKFEVDDITDWMIIRGKKRYTPDDVYLMG